MIVAGVILLLVGYLLSLVLPVPLVLATVAVWLGWILLIVGVILLLLDQVGRRPVGGRRHYRRPVGGRRHYRRPVGGRRHYW